MHQAFAGLTLPYCPEKKPGNPNSPGKRQRSNLPPLIISAASLGVFPNTPIPIPKPHADTAQMTMILLLCHPFTSGNWRKYVHQKNSHKPSLATIVMICTINATRYSIAACRLATTYEPMKRAVRKLALTRNISRSEEHTSELQSQSNLVCRLLLEKKKKKNM